MAAFSPSTCGCRFLFNGPSDPVRGDLMDFAPLNDEQARADGHHTEGTRLCPIHADMDPAEAMKHAVMDINQTKNIYEGAVQERAKRLYPNELVELSGKFYVEDENGNLKRVSQAEVDARAAAQAVVYSIADDKTLELYLPDMTAEERADLDQEVALHPVMRVIDEARPKTKITIAPLSTKLALDAAVKG